MNYCILVNLFLLMMELYQHRGKVEVPVQNSEIKEEYAFFFLRGIWYLHRFSMKIYVGYNNFINSTFTVPSSQPAVDIHSCEHTQL